jgi:DUF3016 family protein
MKPSRLLPLALLMLAVTQAAATASAYDKSGPRVELIYFEPQRFTDINDSAPPGTEKGKAAILAEMREFIVKRAGQYLPDGQHITITVTDVDLAGEFEPWRGPQWDDVRIVKDIYPPRIKLAFRIVDAEGNTVKEGERDLTDLSFQMRLSIDQNDRLRHEKDLLDDWMRSDIRAPKKRA